MDSSPPRMGLQLLLPDPLRQSHEKEARERRHGGGQHDLHRLAVAFRVHGAERFMPADDLRQGTIERAGIETPGEA